MDPLSLTLAAVAYVAAGLAKKSADSVIEAAYRHMKAYILNKLGPKQAPEQLDAVTLKGSGLADDPELLRFGRDVLARSSALRRARLVESVVRGARVLWVDDYPENNRNECSLLRALGVEVEQVRSTQEAIDKLSQNRYDLLLSDIARHGVADAGLRMLKQLVQGAPPLVFYVGRLDQSQGVPCGAFGIADRPEPLLHLVLDVFERHRV